MHRTLKKDKKTLTGKRESPVISLKRKRTTKKKEPMTKIQMLKNRGKILSLFKLSLMKILEKEARSRIESLELLLIFGNNIKIQLLKKIHPRKKLPKGDRSKRIQRSLRPRKEESKICLTRMQMTILMTDIFI